nr:unnamed protein product [Callosobruchus chinensis]
MGLVLAGIITINIWGILSSLLIMLAHWLCFSGLFFLVNIVYDLVLS